MFVATNYDSSSVWTRSGPTALILNRMKAYARASAGTPPLLLCAALDLAAKRRRHGSLPQERSSPTWRAAAPSVSCTLVTHLNRSGTLSTCCAADLRSIFQTPLQHFDVLIHLRREVREQSVPRLRLRLGLKRLFCRWCPPPSMHSSNR